MSPDDNDPNDDYDNNETDDGRGFEDVCIDLFSIKTPFFKIPSQGDFHLFAEPLPDPLLLRDTLKKLKGVLTTKLLSDFDTHFSKSIR